MTRFLNGPVVAMFLAAACALTAYVLVTGAQTRRSAALTERDQGGVGVPAGRQQAEYGREAPAADAASRSVNVAYHRRPPQERRAPEPAVWDLNPGVRRSLSSYRVNWRRRYHGEHAHVQRLLDELRRARHVQAVHEIDWRAKQIAAAEVLGREGDAAGTDPWPHCPDPYDHGGASWDDTVQCENSGSWLDSPGYYRCGLQLDPRWEQRFGRMCP